MKIYFQTDSTIQHGFDLKKISIQGRNNAIVSPHAMVMVAICDLLNGVRRFLLEPKQKKMEFVACDTSFTVLFNKTRNLVEVFSQSNLLDTVSPKELAETIFQATYTFYTSPEVSLEPDDPVKEDVERAIELFERVTRNIQTQ